jgi:capsular polysaccharide biosynthesis protein
MNEYKEVELIDYLNIIWKRKWLILIPTILLAVVAGIISFLLPQKWEIDILIQPSKFLFQTREGRFEELVVVPPKQIASQINQAAYNNLISKDLNIDLKKLPKLKAVNITDTSLVRVYLREKDIQKAKLILYSLFKHLKKQLDQKVDVEIKDLDYEIKTKEIEKSIREDEIKTAKNKLNIVKKRIEEIGKEMSDIRKRVEELEKEQRLNLKRENRSEAESLAMLLYSNEIQQSLMNYNTLNELLMSKKVEEENIVLKIKSEEENIKQVDNQIINLNERKGMLDYAQLIKEPSSSLSPVYPKKKLNVLIAGILGLIIFTMLGFFLEYLEKQRETKSKNS